MDSQIGIAAGTISSLPHLHDSESNTALREILISHPDVHNPALGMGVAREHEEPVQILTVATSQERLGRLAERDGVKITDVKFREETKKPVNWDDISTSEISDSSKYQDSSLRLDEISLDSSADVENVHVLDHGALTDSKLSKPAREKTTQQTTNSIQETLSLCNKASAGDNPSTLEKDDVDVGNNASCEAIEGSLARLQNTIRLDVRQDRERTPGDGQESPSLVPVPSSSNQLRISDDELSSLHITHSDDDDEQSAYQSAVSDIDANENESALSDFEHVGQGQTSPATIDVINLGSHAPFGSNLRRPKSLEGYLDLDDTNNPKWTTPNQSQSLRTTPSTSTPQFLEELDQAVACATDLPVQELSTKQDSSSHRLSGILQHELRSRASFTSVSSLSTDYSSSLATDDLSETRDNLEPGFVEVNLHSSASPGDHWAYAGEAVKPKKKGIAGIVRTLFPWKSSIKSAAGDQSENSPQTTSGWKFFNRSPAKQAVHGNPQSQFDRNYPPKGKTHPPTLSLNWRKKQAGMRPATSTTALILENRPQNLPAKNPDEEQKHKEQYELMVKGAKQKEIKVYKQQMKKLAKQLKYEEGIKTLLNVWQTDVLKHWEHSKTNKKTREMWWQGIPPSIRGRVWMLAIGNELNITSELFEIFLARAKDRIKVFSEPDIQDFEEVHEASREDSLDVIRLDVSRTFPHLCIYQKGGPYFDRLHSILGAYACYRPDIGYVQGMSFIAAVFLLYLEPADAFCCFANVLNKSCQLAFFRLDQSVMQSYFDTYEEYFDDNLPDLCQHFKHQCLTPDLYIIDWMYTLYSKSLPLDVACRVWDIFFRDGEEFIFRTALGILHMYEEILISLEFIHLAQFLTKLPEDIECERLFKSIEVIDMHQKKFSHVLSTHLANNSHH